ncbi:MAG: hypothetical protein ACR2JE_09170 [Acidobacteriaceae bacterium]
MRTGLENAREPGQDSGQPPVRDPGQQDRIRQDLIHRDLLGALTGKDAQGSRRAAERTRRAVRMAVVARREQQVDRRHNLGVAIACCLGISILLTPALWSSVDDFIAGEHFGDIPTQVALLLMMLFPAIIAALIAGWRTQSVEDGHRSL